MKRLQFSYCTAFHAVTPVTEHRFSLRCLPYADSGQSAEKVNINIAPADFLNRTSDGWGNSIIYGVTRGMHKSLDVDISGIVVSQLDKPQIERRQEMRFPFLYPTRLTAADDDLREFVNWLGVSASDGINAAYRAAEAVNEHMDYLPGITDINTNAAEAFSGRRGVCQDYAHIMTAMMRIIGIPARYCAGMVIGEGQCHAWVEVLVNGNWHGFDPTAGRAVNDTYIKLAHGRDFNDCTLSRGIFRGNCAHSVCTKVSVSEI